MYRWRYGHRNVRRARLTFHVMKPSIAIVGCGPSGMATAIMLHDNGFDVTLLDQFDQPGPVGSGLMLQPSGLSVLESIGLRHRAEYLGQRIDGMLGRLAISGKKVLDIRYQHLADDLYGIAIHRAALFDVLYEAVLARGLTVQTRSSVSQLQYLDIAANGVSNHKVRLMGHDCQQIEGDFDLVIDASGAQSQLTQYALKAPRRRHLNYGAFWTTVRLEGTTFDRSVLEQRYERSSVMVGVLPCGVIPGQTPSGQSLAEEHTDLATFFWSIKASDVEYTRVNGLDAWKQQVMRIWPETEELLVQISDWGQLIHAEYSHHTLQSPYGQQIAFVGDCAHATSPQLGQGANMGLIDAYALSSAINEAFESENQSLDDALRAYAKSRRTHVKFYQAACYFLTPFYQSDSRLLPFLRDLMFEPTARIPFMRKQITALGSGAMFSSLAGGKLK